ncbi:MAG TPA: hypothetical protein VGG39_00530 [Polyangiaceae bacterium]|jgi:hypothetical protein
MSADDPEQLPMAAGSSPFRIKGVAYLGHAEYADAFVPGGSAAVTESFRDPCLRAFFGQRFLAASWYDALPMVPVWYASANLLRQNPTDFLKTRARHQALRDIRTVYRFILKFVSAEAVALRVPHVVQRYFDFGTVESSVVGRGLVRAALHGVPTFLVPWLRTVSETYLEVALELAGVTFAQLRRLPVVSSGEAHGLPVASVGLELQLDPSAG